GRGLGVAAGVMVGVIAVFNLFVWSFPTADTSNNTISGFRLLLCATIGGLVTAAMMWITDVYTGSGSRFVERIARASEGGHGTNVISGLAVGMQATTVPVAVIVLAILITHSLAGLFGVAIA